MFPFQGAFEADAVIDFYVERDHISCGIVIPDLPVGLEGTDRDAVFGGIVFIVYGKVGPGAVFGLVGALLYDASLSEKLLHSCLIGEMVVHAVGFICPDRTGRPGDQGGQAKGGIMKEAFIQGVFSGCAFSDQIE